MLPRSDLQRFSLGAGLPKRWPCPEKRDNELRVASEIVEERPAPETGGRHRDRQARQPCPAHACGAQDTSIIAKAPDKSAQAVTDALLTALRLMPTLFTRSPMTTARSSPTIRPSPRDLTPKATSPTPTIPGSPDSTRTPTDSSVSICPRAAISTPARAGPQHLWTSSTTGHGNVLAPRLQISSSQKSTHLLHLRVQSALRKI